MLAPSIPASFASTDRESENRSNGNPSRFSEVRNRSNGNSGEEYHCRWSIAWPEHEETQTIVGIDGVQALMLAMRNAHGALLRRRERDALDIRWLDENQLGLPNRDEEL
jgi:hypothetical protein